MSKTSHAERRCDQRCRSARCASRQIGARGSVVMPCGDGPGMVRSIHLHLIITTFTGVPQPISVTDDRNRYIGFEVGEACGQGAVATAGRSQGVRGCLPPPGPLPTGCLAPPNPPLASTLSSRTEPRVLPSGPGHIQKQSAAAGTSRCAPQHLGRGCGPEPVADEVLELGPVIHKPGQVEVPLVDHVCIGAALVLDFTDRRNS